MDEQERRTEEATVLIERSRWEYNPMRPHSPLAYRPPAPGAWLPCQAPCAPLRRPGKVAVPEHPLR